MSYTHIDILAKQSSKHTGEPCGDVFGFEKDETGTIVVLSDGLGSGIKANIAANLCVSRILGLVKNGASIRQAFASLVKTMNSAWGKQEPFAVFTICKILNNGQTTILTYEMPLPIIISNSIAQIANNRTYTIEKAVIHEANAQIEWGDRLLMFSDGITQAGIGNGLPNGWEENGILNFLNLELLNQKPSNDQIVNDIHQRARIFWGKTKGDDCSVVMCTARKGITVNVFSGPPQNKNKDKIAVDEFINSEGIKIVCGGSTAKMFARQLNQTLEVIEQGFAFITPPAYKIKSLDLVTEGIVTLNQVNNLIEEEISFDKTQNPVFDLIHFLKVADRVVFFVGTAQNIETDDIVFKQQHIVPRYKIILRIAEKLKSMEKNVVLKYY